MSYPLELRHYTAKKSSSVLVLAHGAGQGMDSPFMVHFGESIAQRGVSVVQFEFEYMRTARATGKRKPPDREPKLRACWHNVVAQVRKDIKPKQLFIGGKSMGGRMASLVADELSVDGLVCLGYPFHPPGKPDRLRTEHLETIRTQTIICQGERDPFGTFDDVESYTLSKRIDVRWLTDGDHGFKPRKASGRTEQDNWSEVIDMLLGFIDG